MRAEAVRRNSEVIKASEPLIAPGHLVEKAHRLLDRAECHPVKATRRFLAEIPSAPFELWALGASEEGARAELCLVIVRHLLRKERGR